MPLHIRDFGDALTREAATRFQSHTARVLKTYEQLAEGRKRDLDSRARVALFEDRERRIMATRVGLERRIGPLNDILSVEFLERGVLASRSVGIVRIEALGISGSGFMCAPTIFVTNHHVLPNERMAHAATLTLGFEEQMVRMFPPPLEDTFTFRPEELFVTNAQLDVTFVAIDPGNAADDVPWLPLLREQGKINIGHPVNLIHHPDGDAKRVVVHNSHLLDLQDDTDDDMFCWYSGDTELGSSGAPVFNSRWEIIAIHRKAVPKTDSNGDVLDVDGKTMSRESYERDPQRVWWIANEGIRASRAVSVLEAVTGDDTPAAHSANEVVALWNSGRARKPGLRTGWA